MDSKKKVTISWSGGKDSAFGLYKILLSGEFDVVHLHCVIDKDLKRVGLHGVHEDLIEKQAERMGFPLEKIYLPASNNHDVYVDVMNKFYHDCSRRGVDGVVFGDIFLEDLREFRIELLKPFTLESFFPLWKVDTALLARDFINAGFRTILCSADARFFSEHQLGEFDQQFLNNLCPGVDPCGENGEFHTFVFAGPLFRKPLAVTPGEVVKKVYTYQKKTGAEKVEKLESAFWFQDLLI